MSKPKPYSSWIAANVIGDGYGECAALAPKMAEAFHELELRKGLYHCPVWGERQHCWCRIRGTETIVDPTGRQFPTGQCFPPNPAFYEDLTDASEEQIAERVPSGVCLDCGEPVFRGSQFCGESCQRAYTAYLMT